MRASYSVGVISWRRWARIWSKGWEKRERTELRLEDVISANPGVSNPSPGGPLFLQSFPTCLEVSSDPEDFDYLVAGLC